MLAENTHDKYRNYCKKNNCNKIPDQEGPRSVRKYCKNRKNNKGFSCYFCDFCEIC